MTAHDWGLPRFLGVALIPKVKGLTNGVIFQTDPLPRLDSKNKKGTMFFLCSYEEAGMLKIFVEEAAALASITLFVGMIAVWAQLIPQL
jgi:hypothetical protein